jgi:hypothetical protein
MARVTRAGGRIVVAKPDWETFTLAASNKYVTRKIINLICDTVKNSWIGRSLPPMFRELGFVKISVEADTLLLNDFASVEHVWELGANVKRAQAEGTIMKKDGENWLKELKQRNVTGQFFGSVTLFIVSGNKP